MLKIGSSASTNSSGALGTGTGNLFVNNTNNNYTGGTELGNGRIIIGNGSALGTGAILFSSTNLGATILQVTNDTALSQNFTLGSTTANSTVLAVIDTANSVTLNGVLSNRASTQIGGLIKTGSGTMTLLGANTYSGGTTVADGTLIGTTASLQGAIANNSAVTFNQSSTGSYTNIMSGTGLLSKSGSGTVTLTRTNSYSGATTVNQGTLLVDTNGSIASSSLATVNGGLLQVNGKAGDVTVNIGGSLGGSGIVGAVNLNRGGLLNPGNSPGTLTATSATISGGSTYNWQISALTGTAGSAWDLFSVSDLLNMTGVTDSNKWNLVVTADGAFTGWTDNRSYEYVFAQAANLSLSAGFSTDVGTDVTSLFNITTSGFTSLPNASSNASGDFKVVVGSANGLTTLNLMAVPEPSTGSMLGLGLAGLVVTRLLRRKNS
jgi:autotransporter-associated beta strand protein